MARAEKELKKDIKPFELLKGTFTVVVFVIEKASVLVSWQEQAQKYHMLKHNIKRQKVSRFLKNDLTLALSILFR